MRRWILPLLALASVTLCLLAWIYDYFPGDRTLMRWIQTWEHPGVKDFMEGVSLIGSSGIMVGLAGIVAIALFAAHRRREALLATGALGLSLLSPLLKYLIDRPRPPLDLVGIAEPFANPSFPSGHAYQSFIVGILLIALAALLIKRRGPRLAIQALLVLLVAAIGISRVYLGAHWPSDVLGAYVLGSLFLILLFRWYQSKDPAPVSQ